MSLTLTDGALSIEAEEETAKILVRLREQIADSALWRALVALPLSAWADVKAKATVNDASRSAALEAVIVDYNERGYGEDRGAEKPFCIVRPWSDASSKLVATGTWDLTGVFHVTFEIPIPTAYRASVPLATVDFWNKIDRVLREFREAGLTDAGNRIHQPEVYRVSLPGEINPDDNNGRRTRVVEYAINTRSGGVR